MKFVHMADMHWDSAFNFLSHKSNLGDIRRMDQRKAFKKAIDYIKDNKIKYLFISGDLYEQKYIRESTIAYISNLFKEIPETKIYIAPGNHDPLIQNSYYKIYNWPSNVTIFGEKITKIEEDEFNLYGCGFEDFTLTDSGIANIVLEDHSKLNILITHASLDGSKENNIYNPITTKELTSVGFDYVALGHFHKRTPESENPTIVYPGSICSMGFDELGEHGLMAGEISKNVDGTVTRKIDFVPLDDKEFVRLDCRVDEIPTIEDLAQHINSIDYEDNKFYEIILIGGRNFEINKYKLYKLIEKDCVIKIKDSTKIGIDLDELAKEISLRGIFVRKMREEMSREGADQALLEKALEYGLQSLLR